MKYPPNPLTRREVEAVLRAAGGGRTARRNRALLVLMWRTGARVSEALALRVSDYDRTTPAIRIRRGKGGKPRTVPLDHTGSTTLDAWISERRRWAADRGWPAGRAPLFTTLDGEPMSTSYVRAALSRIGRRARLDKRLHAHALRHTYASELALEGVAIPYIQELLGHGSAATTATYLHRIGAVRELVDVVQARDRYHGLALTITGRFVDDDV